MTSPIFPPARSAALLLATAILVPSPVADAAGWQPADWRSFFHGSSTQPKSPPPELRAKVSRAEGVSADPVIESFLNELADALMARDGKRLSPRLSAKYAIAGLPGSEDAREVFQQAIERIPGPLEMSVGAVSLEKNGDRLASVEFTYPKEVKKPKRFRFDAEGKLLASDLFAIKVEQH